MVGMEGAIQQTLVAPDAVIASFSDEHAHLYYRFYLATRVGDKYLCVIVKIVADDAFVLTAYLTDKIKKGRRIWPNET